MYRLLIVDDEYEIADWLFELFQEVKELDLDIYKAYSGEAALELLNKEKIDIVLTDIRMPDISGLQLLEEIKRNWPMCRVIFLTGFNEFDYIYSAIKYEGVNYLLKTEKDEVIIQAVEKTVQEIENKVKDKELIKKAREQMNLSAPLLQSQYLLNLIQGNELTLGPSQELLDEMGILLCASAPVMLLVGNFDNSPNTNSSGKTSQYFYAVKLKMAEYFQQGSLSMSMYMVSDQSKLVWLIQPSKILLETSGYKDKEYDWENTVNLFKIGLESIQAICRESLCVNISFAIHHSSIDWSSVPVEYEKLKRLLNYSTGLGSEMLLTDKNLPEVEFIQLPVETGDIFKLQFQLKKIYTLGSYLESGLHKEFFHMLKEVTDYLLVYPSKRYNPALEIYYSIALMFLNHINKWNLTERIAFKIGLNKLTRLDEHQSWKDAIEYFLKLAQVIFDLQRNEQDKTTINTVMIIQRYIEEHLSEDLSLIKLAEQVHFNASYLSRLFKQVVGTNIKDYIYDLRIEEAKVLLITSNLKIHEIAKMVGYESSHYFARFFRKTTNMTPQEFRGSSNENANR